MFLSLQQFLKAKYSKQVLGFFVFGTGPPFTRCRQWFSSFYSNNKLQREKMANKPKWIDNQLDVYLDVLERQDAFNLVLIRAMRYRKMRGDKEVSLSFLKTIMIKNHNFTKEEFVSFFKALISRKKIKIDQLDNVSLVISTNSPLAVHP